MHDVEIINGKGQAMYERIAWHRLGEVKGGAFTLEDAEREGLGFTRSVEKVNLNDIIFGTVGENPIFAADGQFGALRSDGKLLFAGHGEQWTPFQVREGYEFGQAVRDQAGQADLLSGGGLDDGRKWFLTYDLGEFSIGDYKVSNYLSLTGSFDGSWKLTVLSSPVIQVCANTVAAAKAAGVRHFGFKHTSGIKDRVEQAKAALARHRLNVDQFATLGEALLATPVSARTYGQLLDSLFPTKDSDNKPLPTRQLNVAERGIEEVTKHYKGLQPGVNFVSEPGNAWSFVQAVNTYENWEAPVRKTGSQDEEVVRATRQIASVVSGVQPLTDKAFELVGSIN